MIYQEYLPAFPLRKYIDCYWYHVFDGTHTREEPPVQRCLPLGSVELIIQTGAKPCFINQRGVWEKSAAVYFTGLYTETAFWKTGVNTPMFSIRLKPEGLWDLFHFPSALLVNQVIDAEAVLGKAATQMCNEMLGIDDSSLLIQIAERFLMQWLLKRKTDRDYVAEACRLIRQSPGSFSIETLSQTLYVSKRQLERCFKQQFGTSPKTYQQIIRFRNAYRYARKLGLPEVSWVDVSYESGYADQSHLIRDFKKFSGEVPSMLGHHSLSAFQKLDIIA
ncbi:MAG: helix-turn-helix transcriptional regulator [Williamsia sp.]|nr:helix-turn-helix transcriptional regulator [Williamsia sp.]